jgi:2-polyprenyl-3-methyl-5-hydroxy-6-metoxy-1,4-benzoquinol methylase
MREENVHIDQVKAYYNKFTSHLKRDLLYRNSRLVAINDFISDEMGYYEYSTALDVGCGIGITSECLNKRVPLVTGVDISEANIELAKATHLYSDVEYLVGDFTEMDLGRYDLVCAFDVIEHILPGKREAFLYNLKGHCKGTILATIPNPKTIKRYQENNPKVLQIVDEQVYDSNFHMFEIEKKLDRGTYIYYRFKV